MTHICYVTFLRGHGVIFTWVLTLHSVSIGLMKGEHSMVCILMMWSSRRIWMSSTADTVLIPCDRTWILFNTTRHRSCQLDDTGQCNSREDAVALLTWEYGNSVILYPCIQSKRSGVPAIHLSFSPDISPARTHYWQKLQSLPTWEVWKTTNEYLHKSRASVFPHGGLTFGRTGRVPGPACRAGTCSHSVWRQSQQRY